MIRTQRLFAIRRFFAALFLCFVGLCLSFLSALAEQEKSIKLSSLKRLTVLDQGRKKPFDTYARSLLLAFSSRGSYKGEDASTWLAKLIFDYEKTTSDKVFLINNPELVEALDLELEKKRRYSYEVLSPVLEEVFQFAKKASSKEEKERTILDKEFMRLYHNLSTYINLSSHMEFLKKREDLVWEDEEISLVDTMEIVASEEGQKLINKGEIPDLFVNFYRWMKYYEFFRETQAKASSLMIIPFPHPGPEIWLSPSDAFLDFYQSNRDRFSLLKQARGAYLQGDQNSFDQALSAFSEGVEQSLQEKGMKGANTKLELFYNSLAPFFKAKLFYGLCLLVVLLATILRFGFLYWLSAGLALLAFLIHSIGMISRMLIMARPPVTNLFETFIFVAWIAVLFGLVLELVNYLRARKLNVEIPSKYLGVFIAAFAGLVLLLISGKYAAEGDTMGVMIAVLDSNFWLSTHVISVTIGYAGVCVAGLLGHVYLVQSAFAKDGTEELQSRLKDTYSMLLGALGFGLAFTFLGTMLGGIWADQSWGRFWGWDPKENGALLIVLWSLVLFHSRLAGLIRERGMAIGSIVGILTVLLAWFGINLLGVGLHSYGFTSGTMNGLIIFTVFELIFILLTHYYSKPR